MLNPLTHRNSKIKNSCPPGYDWDDQSENCLGNLTPLNTLKKQFKIFFFTI